jgi:Holliday junction resolvase
MREDITEVETEFEQVQRFVQFADRWKSDFRLAEMRHFLTQDLEKTFAFVVSRYTLEEDEQILRPLYFARIGSDCDDQFIFWVALMLAVNFPKKDLLAVEVKETSKEDIYCHILAALRIGGKIIFLDGLPGSQFGKVDYEADQMRIRSIEKFL